VVVWILAHVRDEAAVAVAVHFHAVVLGTVSFCSISDFLNATIFGLSTCFEDLMPKI